MDERRIGIAARVSLAVCLASFLAVCLHLGPLQDKFKTKYVRVDGTALLWIGERWPVEPYQMSVSDAGIVRCYHMKTASRQWAVVGVQLPFIALVAAVLPACQFVRQRRRRRRLSSGLCLSCGYDLRGTPGRCPECGTVIMAALPHNPPMHRTGTAGKIAIIRRLAARGPGR